MPDDLNVLALVKGRERFVFLYAAGRWASDDSLDFTWHNAAVLAQRARQKAGRRMRL